MNRSLMYIQSCLIVRKSHNEKAVRTYKATVVSIDSILLKFLEKSLLFDEEKQHIAFGITARK